MVVVIYTTAGTHPIQYDCSHGSRFPCQKVCIHGCRASSVKVLFARQPFLIPKSLYTRLHFGETKTQRKWFLDEKRDGLVDESRVNNKENKNNRAVFMLYLFAYNIKPMPK